MNSKIIKSQDEKSILPKQPVGKSFYEHLQKIDKDFVAFINADNINDVLTYGDVLEFSKNLSINLRNFGIQTNDVIGIVAVNCIEYFLPILAGFYLGAAIHLIDSNCTQHELKHLFSLSKPKIVFCSKTNLENVKILRSDFNIKKLIMFDGNCENIMEDIIEFRDLTIEVEDSFLLLNDYEPNQHIALILNSSGTTGLPKGVMLTDECVWTCFGSSLFNSATCDVQHTAIITLPLSHCYGFCYLIFSLLSLSKLIVMNKFKTELFLELIQNFQIKKLWLVPTLLNLLATNPKTEQFNLSSVEDIISGSAPLSANLIENIRKKINLKNIYQVYGSSEVGTVALSKNIFNSNFSQGKLLYSKLLKIADLNTNEPLGPEEYGEICIKGGIFKGYINDEEKTRESFDNDGFFRTGDFGYYDEKGLLYLTDRIKDIIKYKAFHFSPIEIEEVLLKHPQIEDAAVVGKPDNHVGELPMAFIVKKPNAQIDQNEIISYVAKFFSNQKQLHGGVQFIEKIPRNALGKVLRKSLKELIEV